MKKKGGKSHGKDANDKPKCSDVKGLPDLCDKVNDKFKDWKDWGEWAHESIDELEKYVLNLENAVCQLESHIVHGGPRPAKALICDQWGNPLPGTLKDEGGLPHEEGDPPEEPFE